MSLTDVAPLANHLWQSTVFLALVWVLTGLLKRNHARVRYRLWLAASVKFLIPFAPLVALGRQFRFQSAPVFVQPNMTYVVETIGQPFSGGQLTDIASQSGGLSLVVAMVPLLLFGVWLSGCGMHLLAWCVRWRRVAGIARRASPLHSGREVDALRRLEPIVGIRGPVHWLGQTRASNRRSSVFGAPSCYGRVSSRIG